MENFLTDQKQNTDSINALKARVKGNKPALPLIQYSGTYDNELYGFISIAPSDEALKIKFMGHKNLTAKLQYMDNDEWLISYSNPAFGYFPVKFITVDNKVAGVDIKVNDFIEFDPYRFTKQ